MSSTDSKANGELQRPENRSDLRAWIRARLHLPVALEQELLETIDHVLNHQKQLWQESKEQALLAVSVGFAKRLAQMRDELEKHDARTHKVADYFEHLVHTLTDELQRDPKTQLLTFPRFMERVEASLAVDQRGRWCAFGMADITAFKSHNDTLGHAAGDRILDRVARLLRSEVRDSDFVLYESLDPSSVSHLHGRFGGDEFCFFLSNLKNAAAALTVAERFWRAVAGHDWSIEDPRLVKGAVGVDIGVVCLRRGRVSEFRSLASQIARELLERADTHLYEAKRSANTHVLLGRVRLHHGVLLDLRDNDPG